MKNSNTFVNPDHGRKQRTGVAEAIFCEGKTPAQVASIFEMLRDSEHNVIGTRASKEHADAVQNVVPEAVFHEEAHIIALEKESVSENARRVAVVTAGTSDIPVAEEAAICAELMGLRVQRIYDVGIAGLHRLTERAADMNACGVVLAVAGMEGALASVVAGLVESPVIAVPTSIGYGASFGGVAALLTMLNSCAPGVSVVNIDNGYGAACMAAKILK